MLEQPVNHFGAGLVFIYLKRNVNAVKNGINSYIYEYLFILKEM